jgi:hypothetical protein
MSGHHCSPSFDRVRQRQVETNGGFCGVPELFMARMHARSNIYVQTCDGRRNRSKEAQSSPMVLTRCVLSGPSPPTHPIGFFPPELEMVILLEAFMVRNTKGELSGRLECLGIKQALSIDEGLRLLPKSCQNRLVLGQY